MFAHNLEHFTESLNETNYTRFEKRVTTYVRTGKTDKYFPLSILLKHIDKLTTEQKVRLTTSIRAESLGDDIAYWAPAINNIPLAFRVSALTAFLITLWQYHESRDNIHAMTMGMMGGVVTFFGGFGFKMAHTAYVIHQQDLRAQEIIKSLGDQLIIPNEIHTN